MTPLQAQAHAEHLARRARFQQAAISLRESQTPAVEPITPLPKPTIWEIREKGRKQLAKWESEKNSEKQAERERLKKQLSKIEESGFLAVPLKKIALETIIKYKPFGVVYADLFSQRRWKEIVLARQECYYRARMETGKSLPEIARFFGGRDHTTILHGIRQYQYYQACARGEAELPSSRKKWFPLDLIIQPKEDVLEKVE